MSRRLNGAMLSYTQVAVRIATTLLYTPILVGSLGQEGYGLFSIVGALAAYFYMIDFGMNDGVMRFFVRYETAPDERRRFLKQMLGFYAGLGLLVGGATFAIHGLAPLIFGTSLSGPQVALLQDMIIAVGAGAAVMVAFNPLGALLSAMERFVFLRSLEIFTALASTLLTVVLLWQGFGALMVVIVMSGALVFQVFVRLLYIVLRLKIAVGWAWPGWSRLKPVALYAAPIFVSILVEQIYWKLDNLIIGAVLGAAPVALYAIGTTFNKHLMSFGTAISRIMAPEIIRQADSDADASALNGLLIRVSRLQALFLLLVISGLSLFGARFIDLWLGPDYGPAYTILLIVLIPYTLELIGNARNILLQVKNLYWHRSLMILAIACLNIPLTIVLLNLWGVVGAAVSTGIGLLLGYIAVAILLQLKLGLDMGRYFRELAKGLLPVLVLCVPVGLALNHWMIGGWTGLFLCIVIYTPLYVGLMLAVGMNPYERGLVRRVLTKLVPGLAARWA
ncbi:MAG: oligosaccharide flippase family protein [Brevundimonas sp.]|uniref:oligosaccharide flippase family protein n=1 Tax=Brevundimonas sp. TaxID=1871086 RepID=UPI0027364B6B|nr:oligosaccharide flippase family protein [Brevundimonas sp.]MDP3378633.1 oligosaccharide flippase family protein [Brevundimonas sp.]